MRLQFPYLRRPWPLQRWRPLPGEPRLLIIHHSPPLARFGKCRCMGCCDTEGSEDG
jgi:hypothetical protein